jgi:sucrose-6-phosphatase
VAKFLLVTDLDNTLVGDDQALAELNQYLTRHRQDHGTLLVYSTGRSLTSYQELTATHSLLEPDALVAGVGTEIYHKDTQDPDPAWAERLSQGWNRDLIVATTAHFADLVPQPDPEQRPFKVSYYLSEAVAGEVLPQLQKLLQDHQLDVKLVYSSGKDLDILPRQGDKGEAMAFLRQAFGMAPEHTVA